jgi:hypothetical protein
MDPHEPPSGLRMTGVLRGAEFQRRDRVSFEGDKSSNHGDLTRRRAMALTSIVRFSRLIRALKLQSGTENSR